MLLRVDRRYKKSAYTIGKLYVDGVYVCDTLEDAVRPYKIAHETAIPAGTYELTMNAISPKFQYHKWALPYGGFIPRLLDVPNYSGVLIHPGNTAADTDGCILVGRNRAVGKVLDSQATFKTLMDRYLWPAKLRGESITISLS